MTAATAELNGSAEVVGDGEATVIDREEMQKRLIDVGVEFSTEDLAALTDEQANLVAEWVEQIPRDNDDGEYKADFDWWVTQECPDFLRHGEKNGEILKVTLREDPEISAASDPAPPAPVEPESELVATKKHLARINAASELANKRREYLEDAASEVRAAKAREKECREDLDNAEKALSKVIADAKHGHGHLPFDDAANAALPSQTCTDPIAANPTSAQSDGEPIFPLVELSAKMIKKLIGDEEFQTLKDQEDPVGLSDNQLEKFAEHDIETVQGLEKWMREDAHWWDRISGFGEKAIQRVISTLAAFRRVHPMPNDGK